MKDFDLQPHLVGELLELRPLRPEDWDPLFQVASDPKIWEQHPADDRHKEEVFREFFKGALESCGALVAIDRKTGAIIGSSRYNGYAPEKGQVEIGWTFLARAYWGRRYDEDMKRLMLEHAFRHVNTVIFEVGEANVRSRMAMQKIGAVLTDRRVQRVRKGRPVDHVIFEIRNPKAVR